MKNFFKVFFLMLLMVIGSNDVMARSICSSVNNQDVCASGEDVPIGEGTAKLESVSGDYVLTLNNVDINDYKLVDDKAYGIYFNEGDLTIKLEGNNNINFQGRDEAFTDEYNAIFVKKVYNLNIIGNGVLNINLDGDYDLLGIVANYITLGEDNKSGPTINGNIESGAERSILISGDFDIHNTNIKAKLKGDLAVGIFSNVTYPCTIKNSDINLDVMTSSEGMGIFSYDKDLMIEESDILIKTHKYGDETFEIGVASPEKITIKDSKMVIITSDNADDSGSLFNNDDDGSIELIHTDGREFLFVANSMIISEDVTYNNIENTMVYVHSNSLEDIKLTSEYNISNVNELVTNKYMVITTGIDNNIISGNNQSIEKGSATSYNVLTNHFRYLVKSIKLDGAELNEEDYELSKDGKVILTNSGLDKLNGLDVGSYKLIIDYYAGEDLEVDFKIIDKIDNSKTIDKIDNPKTIDNITLYTIMFITSLISLVIYHLYRNRKTI